mgnify:CR=1
MVKYDLCPFAESVFQSGRIRYRTHFGDSGRVEEKYQIIDRLRFEILDLLNSDEEQVSLSLSLRFKGLSIYTVGALYQMEWCIR